MVCLDKIFSNGWKIPKYLFVMNKTDCPLLHMNFGFFITRSDNSEHCQEKSLKL
jgi:hypothetical protein